MTPVSVEESALEVVRQMDSYINLLKTLLGDAYDARQSLLLSLPTAAAADCSTSYWDVEGFEKPGDGKPFVGDDFALSQRQGPRGGYGVSGPFSSSRAYVDPAVNGRLDAGLCMAVQNALLAAGMTSRDSILDMLGVAASINDGLVRLQETSYALRQLGLSRSSEAYLPGYLIKQMQSSHDFERVGKGAYRWLLYPRPEPKGAPVEIAPAYSETALDALSGDALEPIV